jgi:hypothetical protein
MTHKMTGDNDLNSQILNIQDELLLAILDSEETIEYPWNPGESEEYLTMLEDNYFRNDDDFLSQEINSRSQNFYNHLDSLWEKLPASLPPQSIKNKVLTKVQNTLNVNFGASIPQGWLNTIAKKAADIFQEQQTTSQQLVECVQAVLPNWSSDDLLVMARPFAYNMRNKQPQNFESLLGKVENLDWKNLSTIEQARVSLAVAHFALKELNSNIE